MQTLSKNAKFLRINNAAAAATTLITSSAVDMKGFDACCFTVAYGGIDATATNTVKIQQSSDDGSADAYSDLDNSTVTVAADDDNQIVVVDVVRPQKRYLKCVLTRGVATTVIDGIFAQQYQAKTGPVSQPTTVVQTVTLLSPAEA